ncbi:hypothetical protein [Pseudomonas syringae]|uniref:hypothetical protein n=1 Tax=Pseudomonas syringae TaxID=317 RepID=UPI000A77B497|nr:hypothetical protein [Pseudomonas syringae]
MEINAAAKLDISPKGSQIAVNALFAFSALSFSASVWLNYSDKPYLLAIFGSAVFLVLGSIGWWVSHKNEALAKSHPFTLNMGSGEQSVSISSDARSLPEVSYIQSVLAHWSSLVCRRPLPEADGMIGKDGIPIDSSKVEADLVVRHANALADQQVQAAIEMFNKSASADVERPPSPVVTIIVPPSVTDS